MRLKKILCHENKIFFNYYKKTFIIFCFFNTYLLNQSLDGFDYIELDINQALDFKPHIHIKNI